MTQSLGVSVGNANSYVAMCREDGKIEVLLNEYGNGATPSVVAFTDEGRFMGQEASFLLAMNMRDVIYNIMSLLGKPYEELEFGTSAMPLYLCTFEEEDDGQALVVVQYCGRKLKYSITQVLAMLFTKLRQIAKGATECVLSYPQFFDDDQRSALMQAALASGLKPLQMITEMSAVMLDYAYSVTTKEDGEEFVAFVNLGESYLQTAVAWLKPREDVVRVLAVDHQMIGGGDFDRILGGHLYKIRDKLMRPKSLLRLLRASEKLKRMLTSADNTQEPINMGWVIPEDENFTDRIDVATFEKVIEPVLERIESCLKRTLQTAEANFAKRTKAKDDESEPKFQLDKVELVGGSIRVPSVKQLAEKVFHARASTTLDTEAAVARGCALQCKTLKAGTKVERQIKIVDWNGDDVNKPISLECDRESRRIEAGFVLMEYIFSTADETEEGDKFAIINSEAMQLVHAEYPEEDAVEQYTAKLAELKLMDQELLAEWERKRPGKGPYACGLRRPKQK